MHKKLTITILLIIALVGVGVLAYTQLNLREKTMLPDTKTGSPKPYLRKLINTKHEGHNRRFCNSLQTEGVAPLDLVLARPHPRKLEDVVLQVTVRQVESISIMELNSGAETSLTTTYKADAPDPITRKLPLQRYIGHDPILKRSLPSLDALALCVVASTGASPSSPAEKRSAFLEVPLR